MIGKAPRLQARALTIDGRLRSSPVAVAAPGDFQLGDAGAVDARLCITQPHISLYCLDLPRRQALFVETEPGVDLSAAPFLYRAQYDGARRVIRVPFDVLYRLADAVPLEPSRLILVHSVGRCGSTLVSQALRAARSVASLSEPDVFSQLRDAWIENGFSGRDREKLVTACLRLQCAPALAGGAHHVAIKFRSGVMDMAPLLHQQFPAARTVFLYRNVMPWTRSFLRFMGVTDPAVAMTRLDLLVRMWLAPMELCLELRRTGVPLFIARYEELTAAPAAVLGALFEFCGLADVPAAGLAEALSRDSQEGSAVSRASLDGVQFELSAEHRAEVTRLMRGYAPAFRPDTLLPGTFMPAAGAP